VETSYNATRKEELEEGLDPRGEGRMKEEEESERWVRVFCAAGPGDTIITR
jgi:hypothetical protein